jgi:hypothetical protein
MHRPTPSSPFLVPGTRAKTKHLLFMERENSEKKDISSLKIDGSKAWKLVKLK